MAVEYPELPDGIDARKAIKQISRFVTRVGEMSGNPHCYDCGLFYGSPEWVDVSIPSEWWIKIAPHGDLGGFPCFNCMTLRLMDIGARDVPCRIRSGPWKFQEGNAE